MKVEVKPIPPPNRTIGETEPILRAVLERELRKAGLSFPGWTVLVFLDSAGPLALGDLVRRQLGAHVVEDAPAAWASVERLLNSGLVADTGESGLVGGEAGTRDNLHLALTMEGETVYRPVRQAISGITDEFYDNLHSADLAITHLTLAETDDGWQLMQRSL